MRPLTIRAYWCPKSAGVRAEWEDGFAFSEPDGVAAVADGATWSSQSRAWARDLTTQFVAYAAAGQPVDSTGFPTWTEAVRGAFVDTATPAPPSGHVGDGWWSEEVAARGAAATFVGLQFDGASSRWAAVAVGDACLFHFGADGGVLSFPVVSSDEFGSSPTLISSVQPVEWTDVRAHAGEAAVGDLFVLATDAISSWIVGELEAGGSPERILGAIRSDNFGDLVTQLRSTRRIPDDDVTVVRVHVAG